MQVTDEQFREFVLDAGLVSRRDYEAAEQEATESGAAIDVVLVRRGSASPDDLRRIRAHALGIPFVSLRGRRIPFATLSSIPEPIARQHNVIAFDRSDNTLEVALLDVSDLDTIDFVRRRSGCKIIPRLTDSESMKDALIQYQRALKGAFGDMIQDESEALRTAPAGNNQALSAEHPSSVRIVDALLKHAIVQCASDIHVDPFANETLIRYRIDGVLHDAMMLPAAAAAHIAVRIKSLANLTADPRLPQDGRFKAELDGEHVSFRASTIPTQFGEKTVLRLQRSGGSGFALEGLGFHGAGLERVHDALRHRAGMVVVCGPEGSGKTTTLYTMLDLVNVPGADVSTIEDPIEFHVPRVNQTQVRADIGFTYAAGLRALMRQDPDTIMVGGIPDAETAALAVGAAHLGHLVLAALDTDSAPEAVVHLRTLGIDSVLLTSTLNAVVGQQLVRKLAPEREAHALSTSERRRLAEVVDLDRVSAALRAEHVIEHDGRVEDMQFYRPKPSAKHPDGFDGHTGVYEVLAVTPLMRSCIAREPSVADIAAQARRDGALSIAEDALCKAARGLTSVDEVLRTAET